MVKGDFLASQRPQAGLEEMKRIYWQAYRTKQWSVQEKAFGEHQEGLVAGRKTESLRAGEVIGKKRMDF